MCSRCLGTVWILVALVTTFLTPAIHLFLAARLHRSALGTISFLQESAKQSLSDQSQGDVTVCTPTTTTVQSGDTELDNIFGAPEVGANALNHNLTKLEIDPKEEDTEEEDLTGQAMEQTQVLEDAVVGMISFTLLVCIFGPLVPLLMVIAPVAIWLNLCALDLANKHMLTLSVGDCLSSHLLVKINHGYIRALGCVGAWSASCFFFVDLQFSLGPVLLYVLINCCILARDLLELHSFVKC